MPRYSDTLLEHARFPKNLERMTNPDGVGTFSLNGHAPFVVFYLRVKSGCIDKISFEAQGCGVTIAACSILTDLATHKSLRECSDLTRDNIVAALGGVPADKMHSPEVAIGAFHRALSPMLAEATESQRIGQDA
jgi:NifU-like protein involved in Fe-S cluster formation